MNELCPTSWHNHAPYFINHLSTERHRDRGERDAHWDEIIREGQELYVELLIREGGGK